MIGEVTPEMIDAGVQAAIQTWGAQPLAIGYEAARDGIKKIYEAMEAERQLTAVLASSDLG